MGKSKKMSITLGESQMNTERNSGIREDSSLCFPMLRRSSKCTYKDENGFCGCNKGPKSHCVSATGVFLLVVLYTALGSIIFMSLEGENEESSSIETAVAASKPHPRNDYANAELRLRTVDRLWAITEDLNILYKENWTRLAAQEVQLFQDTLLRAVRQYKIYQPGITLQQPSPKWSYSSAFLYSLTLITTIGYGGLAPRTQWGRIAALIYALFGIPVVLLYLSSMGEGLATGMRYILRFVFRKNCDKVNATSKIPVPKINRQLRHKYENRSRKLQTHTFQYDTSQYHSSLPPSVPISICIFILVCYIAGGAFLFHKIQNWSLLESLYFCFTSLGTIGFGDLVPTGNLSLFVASAYILIGMAVVALCFNLIQFEIVTWISRFGIQQNISRNDDFPVLTISKSPKTS